MNGTALYFAGRDECGPTQAIDFSWIMSVPFLIGDPRPGMRREALMPWSLGVLGSLSKLLLRSTRIGGTMNILNGVLKVYFTMI